MPLVDASAVLVQKEEALRHKHPAAVLVHDFANSRQQMLPLIRPLHQAGFIVLVVGLRGSGPGGIGSTFGLCESMDVKAAVEMLRRRSFVDPQKIAILGIGTGATAALLAAKDDPQLAALVLDHPLHDAPAAIAQRLIPDQPLLQWMQPLCKWGFELYYRADID